MESRQEKKIVDIKLNLITFLSRLGQLEDLQTSIADSVERGISSGKKGYSNVGRLFCTPAPPKFTKKLAVDSFFNFGS